MADFTNFCCRSGGSNTNAGTRTGSTTIPGTAADLTYAGGGWVQGTRVFTVVAANPVADGVAVGDFANVGGTFIGRVSARDTLTITIDGTKKVGSSPATGTLTLKIGGAFAGPSGAGAFPFDLGEWGDCKNTAGDPVRINFKNDQTYAPTAAWTLSNTTAPAVNWQGFTTAYGDLGKAIIQGPASGASFILLTLTGGTNNPLRDFSITRNGSTGNAVGVSGNNLRFTRVSIRDMMGNGLTHNSTECFLDSCEFDSNAALGMSMGSDVLHIDRCRFTRNGTGGVAQAGGNISGSDSLFANNTGIGLSITGSPRLRNTDFYNNSTYGVSVQGAVPIFFENCNFLKNTTAGILAITGVGSEIVIRNCGFGVGTQANGTNVSSSGTLVETGTVNYATGITPWTAPTTGDFTVTLAAAINAGFGTFTQLATSYNGTLNSPNIGCSTAVVAAGGLIRNAGTHGGCGA